MSSLTSLPEEILYSILNDVAHCDPLTFFTCQRTCKRFRSAIQYQLNVLPETLQFQLQPPRQPRRDIFGSYRPHRRSHQGPNAERQEEEEEEWTDWSDRDPLEARFGFLFGSRHTTVARPLHTSEVRMSTTDYFRLVPWASSPDRRASYLRPEASWRSIPLLFFPEQYDDEDTEGGGQKDTASVSSSSSFLRPRITRRLLQGLSVKKSIDHKESRTTTPRIRRIQAHTTVSSMGGPRVERLTRICRCSKNGEEEEVDEDTTITLGTLFDLLLSPEFARYNRWELWTGQALSSGGKKDDRFRRDPETATLVLRHTVQCTKGRGKAYPGDGWEPGMIGEGKFVMEKEQGKAGSVLDRVF